MGKLRRGFKSQANELAAEVRRDLDLGSHEPICPWKLAEKLGLPIVPLSDLLGHKPEEVRYLLNAGKNYFSAVTIFHGPFERRRTIFHNDGHATTRQRSNIGHELAHAILHHSPTLPFEPDPIAEQEAHWLGPTLLVSEEAALLIARQRIPISDAAQLYGVSNSLMRMRLNVTGAYARLR